MSDASRAIGADVLFSIWQIGPGSLAEITARTHHDPARVLTWLSLHAARGLITVLGENEHAYGPALDAEPQAQQRYAELSGLRACRKCHCTKRWSCDEGCYWIEPDLCSSCAEDHDE